MRFLFPGFLFALLAIAIPIIIHLFNFRKFKKVYFSNVKFLKSIEQQTASRQNLKNLLVLAARILAIAFLVFAFARPYIRNNVATASSRQSVSVYIDNSYSMEGVNREGSLLDEARRRAKEIAAAYTLNDKFQLLTNDFEGRHQRLLNYEDFINAVDEVKISAASKNLSQIINRQQDVFAKEPNDRKNIYLISDFQTNLLDNSQLKIDSSVSIRMVRLKSNPLPNVSIDSVWFVSAINKPGEAGKLVARFRNNSDREADNIPIKLLINGQQRSIGNISIPARGSRSDTLSFSGLNAGWKSGQIEITDYPVVFDDRFYFSFNVQPNMRILAINGAGVNPYINAVYQSDRYFILDNTDAGSINYSRLAEYPLLILNEVDDFSSGLIQQLKNYTEQGGNLLILPSLTADMSSLTALLTSLRTDVPQQVVSA
ncbi:MAG TPA: BatA domain-containing protein, partial [Daejeonella sp.]|nr:BatA domain-containing protein [Daejeonella sp.]